MSQSFSNGGADENGDVYPASFNCEDCGLSLSWPVTPGVPASEDPVAAPMLALIDEHDKSGCEPLRRSVPESARAAARVGKGTHVGRDEVESMIASAILPYQVSAWNLQCIMAGKLEAKFSTLPFQSDSFRDAVKRELGAEAEDTPAPKIPWLVAPLLDPADPVGQEGDVVGALQPFFQRLDLILERLDSVLAAQTGRVINIHQSSPSVGAPSGAVCDNPNPTDGGLTVEVLAQQVLAPIRSGTVPPQQADELVWQKPNVAVRVAVRRRDGDNCRICGTTVYFVVRTGRQRGTYLHTDADRPAGTGNLVVACAQCNSGHQERPFLYRIKQAPSEAYYSDSTLTWLKKNTPEEPEVVAESAHLGSSTGPILNKPLHESQQSPWLNDESTSRSGMWHTAEPLFLVAGSIDIPDGLNRQEFNNFLIGALAKRSCISTEAWAEAIELAIKLTEASQ